MGLHGRGQGQVSVPQSIMETTQMTLTGTFPTRQQPEKRDEHQRPTPTLGTGGEGTLGLVFSPAEEERDTAFPSPDASLVSLPCNLTHPLRYALGYTLRYVKDPAQYP